MMSDPLHTIACAAAAECGLAARTAGSEASVDFRVVRAGVDVSQRVGELDWVGGVGACWCHATCTSERGVARGRVVGVSAHLRAGRYRGRVCPVEA